jgi:hypothetical protein
MRVLEGNIDIIGIAETKLDTKMACVVHTCHQSVRRHFDNSKLVMASSTRSYGSTFKPGGTLLLSRGSVTGWVEASGNDDMGRWSWTTYKGSANRRFTIITAYQAACTHAGYETDHQGFFVDLDNAVLFGNQTAILQSPHHRGLTSKSFKHRKTYIASRWKYLNDHKWFERLRAALQREEVSSTTLEALDRDWTTSTLAAEKKCQSYPAGPYSQEIAKLRKRKTVFSHLISSKRKGI